MRIVPPRISFTALAGLLLAAGLAGCGESRPTSPASAHPTSGPVVRARVALAERADVPLRVEVQGVVETERTAALSARVMAGVVSVHVQAGDRVRAGQTLVALDPAASGGQLSQAQGALAQARAALALAERNYQRFRALADSDAASDLELDLARMQYEQAAGAVEQAEGAVAAAASIAGDTRVTAPFAGRIARRMVDVGDLAAPGRPLLLLESEGGRRLAVAIPESLVAASGLSLDAELPVAVDSRPDLGELTGRVVELAPGADPMSHAIRAEIALPVDDLASGAAGRAWIATGSRTAVLAPAGAVLRHGGLELVIIDEDGRPSSRSVTTGARTGEGSIEILSGLSGGERLLVGLTALPPAGSAFEEITR